MLNMMLRLQSMTLLDSFRELELLILVNYKTLVLVVGSITLSMMLALLQEMLATILEQQLEILEDT